MTDDSIWINWDNNWVGDTVAVGNTHNYQRYETNTRKPLAVKYIVPDVNTTILATVPFVVNNMNLQIKIPNTILNILDQQNNTEVINNNSNGMLIQILPDSTKIHAIDKMEGKLDIYDPLGNLVIYDRKMGFNSALDKKTLNFVWIGKNMFGREVGGGTYLVVVKKRMLMLNSDVWVPSINKRFVGVKVDKNTIRIKPIPR
jgi:hypothetical protein